MNAKANGNQIRLEHIVGKTPQMSEVFEMIDKAASVEMPVLVMGETGTGKELVARAIHQRSERNGNPFIAVNTGAVSRDLIASEVFGHKRGAFTSASADRRGVYEQADGGTLFLDEIGTMGEPMQVSLLRVLEYGTFRPVGGEEDCEADVRLIAATNVDIEERVRRGMFRGDLLHRLKVLCILIPPLRDRREDIPLLVHHFRKALCEEFGFAIDSICDKAMACMRDHYDWPGNVRELRNVMAQACVMADDGVIEPKHLPERICPKKPDQVAPVDCDSGDLETGIVDDNSETLPVKRNGNGHTDEWIGNGGNNGDQKLLDDNARPGLVIHVGQSFDELNREYAALTLAYCDNNKTKAASILGVTRKTLHERLRRWTQVEADE